MMAGAVIAGVIKENKFSESEVKDRAKNLESADGEI